MSDTKDIESMLDALTNGCRHSGPLNDYDKRRRAAILAAFAELQRERDQYRNDALGLTSVLAERDARIAELEPDAERYRHARDNHRDFAIMQNIGHDWTRLEPQETDAVIDAARKGEQSCTSRN